MKLNVPERLVLTRSLPEKGNFETMATIETLRGVLFLNEEEVEKFKVTQNGDNVSWGPEGNEEIDIDISVKGKAFLLKVLEELDEKDELNMTQYHILKKFKEDK